MLRSYRLKKQESVPAAPNRARIRSHRQCQAIRGWKRLDVHINKTICERVQRYARKQGCTMGEAVEVLLTEGLEGPDD